MTHSVRMNVFRFVCPVFNTRNRRMSVYSRWWIEMEKMLFIFIMVILLQCVHSADDLLSRGDSGKLRTQTASKYRVAKIKIAYTDSKTKNYTTFNFQGAYSYNSTVTRGEEGLLMHAMSRTQNSINHSGCTSYDNKVFPSVKWIALVERGSCSFSEKVKTAMKEHNASAVIVYDNVKNRELPLIWQGEKNVAFVSISREDGMRVVKLLNQGYSVTIHILPGEETQFTQTPDNNISKTSVLFVSISFIVLMIISLAWLVFYYIQRFRYSHAKERLARRLACAAKKAIAKIPQSTVKSGDKVLEGDHDQCAVCIEQYKPHEVIRILPCTHIFHKSCVDPWLQENRSCPMCKMDILVAYGMQIGTSQESVHHNADPGTAPQLVMEDPEVSSSVEEARAEVVQLSSICLHYNNLEGDEEGDYVQPSSQLLGSQEEVVHLSSLSLHSNNSGGASMSRAEKRDVEESTDKEVKALIEKEFHSGVKSDDDDEDEDDDSVGDVVREESKTHDDDDEEDDDESVRVEDEQDEDKDCCCSVSMPDDKDVDNVSGRKGDSAVVALNIGACDDNDIIEFHQEWDLSPSSASHA